MESKLRIIDNLSNIIEHERIALEGDLVCDCGNFFFKIFHTGKQTKGILAPYLIKYKKQILIEARCTCCGNSIEILNSTTKNDISIHHNATQKILFYLSNDDYCFKIHMMYNYYEINYKTNSFEECFIDITNNSIKKPRRLYEG